MPTLQSFRSLAAGWLTFQVTRDSLGSSLPCIFIDNNLKLRTLNPSGGFPPPGLQYGHLPARLRGAPCVPFENAKSWLRVSDVLDSLTQVT